MQAEVPQAPLQDWDFWSQGLDRMFFSRAYKRATQVGVMFTLMAMGLEQKTIALGLFCGLLVGLFSVWSVEVTVRLLFNGGKHAGLKLTVAAFVKMPFLIAGLFGIAWAGDQGLMNVFAVVVGVLVIHGTMMVMALSTAMASRATNTERYR